MNFSSLRKGSHVSLITPRLWFENRRIKWFVRCGEHAYPYLVPDAAVSQWVHVTLESGLRKGASEPKRPRPRKGMDHEDSLQEGKERIDEACEHSENWTLPSTLCQTLGNETRNPVANIGISGSAHPARHLRRINLAYRLSRNNTQEGHLFFRSTVHLCISISRSAFSVFTNRPAC